VADGNPTWRGCPVAIDIDDATWVWIGGQCGALAGPTPTGWQPGSGTGTVASFGTCSHWNGPLPPRLRFKHATLLGPE
jgi:hypothetical protein